VEGIYRQLFNPDLYLRAYGRIYRNDGAMTPGMTGETADGMSLAKIGALSAEVRAERFRWTPVRRVEIPKRDGKTRPLGIPTLRPEGGVMLVSDQAHGTAGFEEALLRHHGKRSPTGGRPAFPGRPESATRRVFFGSGFQFGNSRVVILGKLGKRGGRFAGPPSGEPPYGQSSP
jgi:hypothetical protein